MVMKMYFWLFMLLLPSALFALDFTEDSIFKTIEVESKQWVKGDNSHPWMSYKTTIISKDLPCDKVNEYGSLLSEQTCATGYFRTEKINDRWWVIDPDGYYNIQRVINSFRKGKSERNKKEFDEMFGSDDVWADKSAAFFSDIGIVGIGAWSQDDVIRRFNERSSDERLSYSVNLRLMAAYGKLRGGTYQLAGNIGYPNQTIFVFDPEFKTFCDSVAEADIASLAGDKDLFGYFSDNELPFGMKNLEGYLTLKNPNDPGRMAAEDWLREKGLPADIKMISDAEKAAFAGYVAECYYKIVSEAIRKADPNHMYLGSRLHENAKFSKEIIQAASTYCDIVSINYYGVWQPEEHHLNNWNKWLNKPFMVTEFYTKAMDAGLANTSGAGYTVHTQRDRGYAYQNFCLKLLQSKNCVGWHYFRYQDNDPTAKGADPSNVDSNKGIVDNNYKPYKELADKMKQFNRQVYSLINYLDNKFQLQTTKN